MMKNKKIAIITNHDEGLYNFRKELLISLLERKYEVIIICPEGSKTCKLKELGCLFISIKINRHGVNPFEDLKLVKEYRKILKKVNPDIVFTYTIKPNIYGGIVASALKIPFFANITGLGGAIQNPGLIQRISLLLYKLALKNANTIFFQNEENMKFIQKNISRFDGVLLPGSGVNINEFNLQKRKCNGKVTFLFLARVMRDKGIDEFLSAAEELSLNRKNVEFHVAGFFDGEYEATIQSKVNSGLIIYHGHVDDIKKLFSEVSCVVLPSYHEGMSNVLLEASASGIPIIGSNIPGCREIIEDGKTGFLCEPKNADSLTNAMNKIIDLGPEMSKKMGLAGREKVINEFDRSIVVSKYVNKLQEVIENEFV